MSFSPLLGNEQLKSNLTRSIGRGHISHFYLLSGPSGSGKRTLARLLSAAILCQGAQKPCMTCPACQKTLSGHHPDVLTVDDPEKKTVPVDLIRQARADIYVRPNEAEHKIYIFPRGQDMGLPSQNALLKILEEPPAYGVFLLLTDNPEKLLPTVRSRCTELRLQALSPALLERELRKRHPEAPDEAVAYAVSRSGGFLGQALEALEAQPLPQTAALAEALGRGSQLALAQLLTPLERSKRDDLKAVLQDWAALLEGALVCQSGAVPPNPLSRRLAAARSPQELARALEAVQLGIQYVQQNVSPAAICGYLVWNLLPQSQAPGKRGVAGIP